MSGIEREMIKDSSSLVNGQNLRVDLDRVRDRLPAKLLQQLSIDPFGVLVGYKMVDGNQFGLALEFANGERTWFFEEELSEV